MMKMGDVMKKKFIHIFILMCFFIPILVNAETDIKSTSIIGNNSVTNGEEIVQNIYINFNGVETNNQASLGLWFVSFELNFDEKVLELVEVKSDDWLSYAAKEENSWVVASFLYDDFTEGNKCIDGETFCGSYNIKLKFKAISNTTATTEISLGEIAALASNMYEDDELTITGTSNSSKTITINEKVNDDNKDEEKEQQEQEIEIVSKSSNRYLSNIEIEGYDIDFNKYTNNYDLIVEESVNSLKITAPPEHEKAKVTIIGDTNFSKYNNKVEIIVVSENGMKNTYTINIKIKMNEEELDKELITEEEKKEFKINEKHLIIGGIILGALLLILIIRFIIVKVNDNRIDKALDDL